MKPGVKTTEFWIVIALIVLAALSVIFNEIPATWGATIATFLGLIYTLARFVLKLQGMGAAVEEVDQLRETLREELKFALAKKERATPVLENNKGHALLSALVLILALCVTAWACASWHVTRYEDANLSAYRTSLITFRQAEDSRPDFIRLISSLRIVPTVEQASRLLGSRDGRLTSIKFEVRGGVKF